MFFPIMIDIEKFNILVIGGGKIANRKIRQLLKYGARPTAIAIDFCDSLKELEGKVNLCEKKFEINDLKSYNIVFAATDNIKLNQEVSMYCKKNNILVNSVDNHENSSFINMGFFETEIEDNKMIVAVSSMGKNPKRSKKIKEILSEEFESNREKFI